MAFTPHQIEEMQRAFRTSGANACKISVETPPKNSMKTWENKSKMDLRHWIGLWLEIMWLRAETRGGHL
jgi:hypothetical protein